MQTAAATAGRRKAGPWARPWPKIPAAARPSAPPPASPPRRPPAVAKEARPEYVPPVGGTCPHCHQLVAPGDRDRVAQPGKGDVHGRCFDRQPVHPGLAVIVAFEDDKLARSYPDGPDKRILAEMAADFGSVGLANGLARRRLQEILRHLVHMRETAEETPSWEGGEAVREAAISACRNAGSKLLAALNEHVPLRNTGTSGLPRYSLAVGPGQFIGGRRSIDSRLMGS